jgi:S-layer homology domain
MRQRSFVPSVGRGLVLLLVVVAPAAAGAQVTPWPVAPEWHAMDVAELFAGAPIIAVPSLDPAAPRTFGPASEVALTVSATQFEAEAFSDMWGFIPVPPPTAGLERLPGAVLVNLFAGVNLPSGALITRVEIDGCDFAGGQVGAALGRTTSPVGPTPVTLLALGMTGLASTPGCGLFPLVLTPTLSNRTIDNAGHAYFLAVLLAPPSVGFSNIRVYYTLQVSPAPGAATFGDVPTSHPFFQFVEALVASGITSGCGGGNFCPDDPLTRGQMATFLAKGLGLHFAP